MDISPTIQANSLQINADDLTANPVTVTITNVEAGTTEQPVFIHVSEFPGRTYRPGKSMRRILVAVWGSEASAHIGRKMTLYNDQSIRFGKDVTGGIRISHMSDLPAPITVALTVTRGSRKPFTVQPIADNTGNITAVIAELEQAKSLPALKVAWDLAGRRGVQSHPGVVAAKDAAKLKLTPKETTDG